MKRPFVRVIKIGGSLLDWPELPSAVTAWIEDQPPACNVLLAGGGRMVDEIRRLDAIHGLDEDTSHWLCIDVLRVTASLIAGLLDDFPLVQSWRNLPSIVEDSRGESLIFNPYEFLHKHEPNLPGVKLPHTWEVTSDSIAARLSDALAADELVIFKATQEITEGMSLEEMAARGIIDSFLPRLRVNKPLIRFVTPPA
jgi:aspartokinase-like uncharacterized kinase